MGSSAMTVSDTRRWRSKLVSQIIVLHEVAWRQAVFRQWVVRWCHSVGGIGGIVLTFNSLVLNLSS